MSDGWLNTPTEIIDSYRVVDEYQYIYWVAGTISYRKRKVTYTTYRYVGCGYTAAKAKADVLNGDNAFSDIGVAPTEGGQYHVTGTQKVTGTWSAWTYDSSGEEPEA
jgi:hypothetical protein